MHTDQANDEAKRSGMAARALQWVVAVVALGVLGYGTFFIVSALIDDPDGQPFDGQPFDGQPFDVQAFEDGATMVADNGERYQLTNDGLCIGIDSEIGLIRTCATDETATYPVGSAQFDLLVSTDRSAVYDEERCEQHTLFDLDDGAAIGSWCLLAEETK